MRFLQKFTIFVLLSLWAYSLEIVDGLGRKHIIKLPPQRVISLSPAITETLEVLSLKDRIIGTSDYTFIKGAMQVGGLLNPNMELIRALRPELVFVMQPSPLSLISSLDRAGIEVFPVSEPRSLDDIGKLILLMGRIFAVESRAQNLREDFLKSVSPVRKKKGKAYIGFVAPPFWTACKGTFLDDLIRRAGWENICNLRGWTALSGEDIYLQDPHVLIVPASSYKEVSPYLRKFPWHNVSAVKMNRVLIIDENRLLRPSPLIFEAYRKIRDFWK